MKLSAVKICLIRTLFQRGVKQRELAKKFKVADSTIWYHLVGLTASPAGGPIVIPQRR